MIREPSNVLSLGRIARTDSEVKSIGSHDANMYFYEHLNKLYYFFQCFNFNNKCYAEMHSKTYEVVQLHDMVEIFRGSIYQRWVVHEQNGKVSEYIIHT
jgi:hypothetical protein